MQTPRQETILTQVIEVMYNSYPKTILVAEDNQDCRGMLRFFLEGLGYKVIEAENGKKAVEAAVFFLPDLILMDLNMPELDGISATEQIRQQDELRNVPIIANSGEGSRGIDLFLNISNFGEGFIGYITKPFSLDDLSEQIEKAFLITQEAA